MAELLTVEEVAALLKIRPRRVYVFVEHPDPALRLPVVRVGKRAIRFRREDVEAWIESRREAVAS